MAISPDGHCHCHCMRGKVAQGLSRLRGGDTAGQECRLPRHWPIRTPTYIQLHGSSQSCIVLQFMQLRNAPPHAAQHTLASCVLLPPPSPHPSFLPPEQQSLPASLPSGCLHPSHVHFTLTGTQ